MVAPRAMIAIPSRFIVESFPEIAALNIAGKYPFDRIHATFRIKGKYADFGNTAQNGIIDKLCQVRLASTDKPCPLL
jgi:hypothetical protein